MLVRRVCSGRPGQWILKPARSSGATTLGVPSGEPHPNDFLKKAAPVGLMCQALHVSRSGFYDWARAEPSARAVRRAKIAVHVKAAFILGRGTYGVRRVHAVLTHSYDPEVSSVSLDLVRNLMQENDLHACQPRAYKVTTVSGAAPTPAIADHVKRDFTASAPGTRLVG